MNITEQKPQNSGFTKQKTFNNIISYKQKYDNIFLHITTGLYRAAKPPPEKAQSFTGALLCRSLSSRSLFWFEPCCFCS